MVNDSWDSDSYSIFTEHTEKKFFDFDSDVLKSRAYKRVYSSVRSARRPFRSQKIRSAPITNLLDEDDLIDLRDHPPLVAPYSLELEKELSPLDNHENISFRPEQKKILDMAASPSDDITETIGKTPFSEIVSLSEFPNPYERVNNMRPATRPSSDDLPIPVEEDCARTESVYEEVTQSNLAPPISLETPATSPETPIPYAFAPIALPRNPHSFIRAAASGKAEKIRHWLLQPGHFESKILREALLSASSYGHDDVVEILLLRGVDVNLKLSEDVIMRNVSHRSLTPLHLAAAGDKSSTVELLLRCGADLSSKDSLNWTPLHLASARGCVAAVRTLLEHQAPIESKASLTVNAEASNKVNAHSNQAAPQVWALLDLVSWSPLFVATYFGAFDAVKVLLENGADADEEPAPGFTLLHTATYEDSPYKILTLGESPAGHWLERSIDHVHQLSNRPLQSSKHVALVEYLVQKGFDPSAPDASGVTPLHLACLHSAEIARVLIRLTKNVSPKSDVGWTPLHIAALWSSDIELAQLLIEAGADLEAPMSPPNALMPIKSDEMPKDSFLKWLTPLGLAIAKGYHDMAVHLLRMGAKPQMPSLAGANVLSIAASVGNPALLVLLSKQGIGFRKSVLRDVGIAELPASEQSATLPELSLCRLLSGKEEQLTSEFAAHGLETQFASEGYLPKHLRLDVDAHDQHGNTPLMRVIQVIDDAKIRTPAINRLLDLGADPTISDHNKRHLLHYSDKLETDEIRRLFIAGADLDAKNHLGQTPLLQLSTREKDPAKIEYLIALGANIYAKDSLGKSAWNIFASQSKSKATRFSLNSISSLSRSDLNEDSYRAEVRKLLNKAKKARPPPRGWVE